MTDLREGLIKQFPPLPREIWFVPDELVKFDEKERIFKNPRPVIVISQPLLGEVPEDASQVIPISRSGYPDRITPPVPREVEKYFSGHKLDKKSVAVLSSPLNIFNKHFIEKIGIIKIEFYHQILFMLDVEILNKAKFNFNLQN